MSKGLTKNLNDRYGKSSKVAPKSIGSIHDKGSIGSSDLGRSIDELLAEIVLDGNAKDLLRAQYHKVESHYANVKFYTKEQILNNAIALRGSPELDIELVTALMNRANKIVTGYELRPAQILSTLEFFRADSNKFCQVNTGEGKTTLTSLIAVVKSLRGEIVDIITSNKVLAEDAVRERGDFYALFGLSVTHNNVDHRGEKDLKTCYWHNVVYGTIGNFEFHYLKDRVGLSEIRGGRQFGALIIDEADNVVLDNATHVAKISGPIAGMEYLKYLYLKIWQKLIDVEKRLGLEKTKASEITDDNKHDIKQEISASKVGLKSNSFIPHFLESYVDRKMDSWISNAISARYDYHKNQHYIICKKAEHKNDMNAEENIIPLDIGVGVTLQNTIWTDLHPFVQIKHNLQVTSDSLSSVFIANSEYIRLYKNIYGLTGTLGSGKEQKIVQLLYNANSTVVPTYKAGKMVYETNKSVDNGDWVMEVTKDAIDHAIGQNRATLIICETVNDLENFAKQLKQNPLAQAIILYKDENDSFKIEKINQEGGIEPGTIVIATNIGGRGTDIKLSDIVKENGGLHVCTTFVASSSRILKQASGRAARQGEPGSSKMIVKKSDLTKYGINFEGDFDNSYIYSLIDKSNDDRIDRFIPQIAMTEQNGKYFNEFADLYKASKLLEVNYFILEDLRLQWALAFDKRDNVKIGQVFDKLRKLSSNNKDYEHKFLNPYFATRYVDYILAKEEIKDSKLYERAECVLNQDCITNDPELLVSLKRFEIMISSLQRNKLEQIASGIIDSRYYDTGYKEKSTRYLHDAKRILNKRIKYLEDMVDSEDFSQILLLKNDLNNDGSNSMLKHIASQYALLKMQLHHVSGLIEFISNSRNEDICISSKSHLSELTKGVSSLRLKIHDDELDQIRNLGEDSFYKLDTLPIVKVNSPTTRFAMSKVADSFASSALKFSFPKEEEDLGTTENDLSATGIFDITKIILSQEDKPDHLLDILSFGFGSSVKSLKILSRVGKYISETISGRISNELLPESSIMQEISHDFKAFEEKVRNIVPKGILKDVNEPVLGCNDINRNDNINGIDNYFGKYTLDAINSILKLRLKDAGIANTEVVSNNYSFIDIISNNIDKLIVELSTIESPVVLVPLNLFNKHAAGLMFIKHENGTILYYIDPENQQIPLCLEQILKKHQLDANQLILETQKYVNCGPEVIENFMLCLTGERLSQEDAILYHSLLVERELVNNQSLGNQYSDLPIDLVSNDLTSQNIDIIELICDFSDSKDNLDYLDTSYGAVELQGADLSVDPIDSIV